MKRSSSYPTSLGIKIVLVVIYSLIAIIVLGLIATFIYGQGADGTHRIHAQQTVIKFERYRLGGDPMSLTRASAFLCLPINNVPADKLPNQLPAGVSAKLNVTVSSINTIPSQTDVYRITLTVDYMFNGHHLTGTAYGIILASDDDLCLQSYG